MTQESQCSCRGMVIQVVSSPLSALENPEFKNFKQKAENWLKGGDKAGIGKEMDSVFFSDDRFELMVDARGYKPEDLTCQIGLNTVEILASRQETSSDTQRCVSTTRSYQLPQYVCPQRAICCLSAEGILLVAVPWQK